MTQHKPFYPAMVNAVRQTLENMVFMEVAEQHGTPTDIPAEELTWTSLLVNDPIQGEIYLALSAKLLKQITGNVFGLDEEEVTSSQGYDILNELLNTIAGLFLTNLLPDEQEYNIGLPSLGAGALPNTDEHKVIWHLITSDENVLKVYAIGESLVALHQDTE